MKEYTFSSELEEYKNKLWKYHVKVPSHIVETLRADKVKRFVCTLNGSIKLHASLMPAGDNVFFIKINKDILKQLHTSLGETIDVSLIKDESKYGIPLPLEFEELLNGDIQAGELFHKLSPGKQRSLLFLVNKVKSKQIRYEKSFIILEHLKEQQGTLDFKILNTDFKNKRGMF